MNMKKICRKHFLILSAFMIASILSLSFSSPCYAKINEGNSAGTTVTYVKEENQKFLLNVSIIGKGSIYDGEAVLRDQINKYEIEYGSTKTFHISPDKGYVLQKITLDGKDITDQIVNGSITVKGMDYEQHLKIYFRAVTNGDKKPENNGQNTGSTTVKTSDRTKIGVSVLVLVSSLFALYALKKKKNKEDENE